MLLLSTAQASQEHKMLVQRTKHLWTDVQQAPPPLSSLLSQNSHSSMEESRRSSVVQQPRGTLRNPLDKPWVSAFIRWDGQCHPTVGKVCLDLDVGDPAAGVQ